ncbi:hypothetical protein [Nocardioides gilvus]|uniref:hypothetical protein n=1 Tax=Nocardioides gilvus TaxID=1735589 RepID=UPI000D748247|nr:hypothetical protein [Nocardioides gilvus]
MTDDTSTGPSPQLAATWRGLLTDSSPLPPGEAPLLAATTAYDGRRSTYGGLLGPLALTETDLPHVRGLAHPIHLVLGGGAGAIAGPMGLATRLGLQVDAVRITLRDPADLAGNVRRVVAALDSARDEGVLDDEVRVHLEVPLESRRPTGGWLRAVDEIGAAELALHLRVDDPYGGPPPSAVQVTELIDAALDRETPYSVSGATRAVSGDGAYGVLNLLLATRQAFDGLGHDEVTATLSQSAVPDLVAALRAEEYLPGARRWFTSALLSDVETVADELAATGLLDG